MLNLEWRIFRYQTVESTNLIVKDFITQNACGKKVPDFDLPGQREKVQKVPDFDLPGIVVVADEQTKGYGMRGHSWQSPLGGLYFSLLLKTSLAPISLPEIPTRVASIIFETLQKFSAEKLEIKRPNDIVLSRKSAKPEKLAGISSEIYKGFLVIGVGVNVFKPKEVKCGEFAENIPVYLEDFPTNSLDTKESVLQAILKDLNVKLEI